MMCIYSRPVVFTADHLDTTLLQTVERMMYPIASVVDTGPLLLISLPSRFT